MSAKMKLQYNQACRVVLNNIAFDANLDAARSHPAYDRPDRLTYEELHEALKSIVSKLSPFLGEVAGEDMIETSATLPWLKSE